MLTGEDEKRRLDVGAEELNYVGVPQRSRGGHTGAHRRGARGQECRRRVENRALSDGVRFHRDSDINRWQRHRPVDGSGTTQAPMITLRVPHRGGRGEG